MKKSVKPVCEHCLTPLTKSNKCLLTLQFPETTVIRRWLCQKCAGRIGIAYRASTRNETGEKSWVINAKVAEKT